VIKESATLMHPKGNDHISISLEDMKEYNPLGGYLVRKQTKQKTHISSFDSNKEAFNLFISEIAKSISDGFFMPSQANRDETLIYRDTVKLSPIDTTAWSTSGRMPVDDVFMEKNFVRDFHAGHHVFVKLSPSETTVFDVHDNRGIYALSNSLLSKLSMLHAYADISDLTLNVTLRENGRIVINDVAKTADDDFQTRLNYIDEIANKIHNAPLSFVDIASIYLNTDDWSARSLDDANGYVARRKDTKFFNDTGQYYFPHGQSFKVVAKALYEVFLVDARNGEEDISLSISENELLSIIDMHETVVVSGNLIFTQPKLSRQQSNRSHQ